MPTFDGGLASVKGREIRLRILPEGIDRIVCGILPQGTEGQGRGEREEGTGNRNRGQGTGDRGQGTGERDSRFLASAF